MKLGRLSIRDRLTKPDGGTMYINWREDMMSSMKPPSAFLGRRVHHVHPVHARKRSPALVGYVALAGGLSGGAGDIAVSSRFFLDDEGKSEVIRQVRGMLLNHGYPSKRVKHEQTAPYRNRMIIQGTAAGGQSPVARLN